MQVLHVVALAHARGAQLVGLPHRHAALDAAAGHPHGEAERVVVAPRALGVLGRRLAPELAAPHHQRLVEQAALLEVLQQPRDRLVGAARVVVVVLLEVAVRVPVGVVVRPARIDLHEPHASLDQPPREQALAAELLGARVVDAVELLGARTLGIDIDRLGRGALHAVGELVALDAALEVRVPAARERVARVPRLQPVEHAPLQVGAAPRGVRQVEDRRPVAAQHGALVDGGHVARAPVLGAADGAAGRVEHHHEPRQVLVDRAEPVVHPAAERGRPAEQLAAVHHQHGAAVDGALGVHALDERDVVDAGGQVGEQVADPRAALAVLPEVPLGTDDAALVAVAAAALGLHLDGLAVEPVELGLVVEGVDMARAAVHEQEDDALGLARQQGRLARQRVGPRAGQRRDAVERLRLPREEPVMRQHARERDARERAAGLPEELAPRAAAEGVARGLGKVRHASVLGARGGPQSTVRKSFRFRSTRQ